MPITVLLLAVLVGWEGIQTVKTFGLKTTWDVS